MFTRKDVEAKWEEIKKDVGYFYEGDFGVDDLVFMSPEEAVDFLRDEYEVEDFDDYTSEDLRKCIGELQEVISDCTGIDMQCIFFGEELYLYNVNTEDNDYYDNDIFEPWVFTV